MHSGVRIPPPQPNTIMFDEKTVQKLHFYVYLLIDPGTGSPFYVGKGKGNRVFNHLKRALKEKTENLKYDTIRQINEQGLTPQHIIVRHGITEDTAFEIEASLIDVLEFMKFSKTNIMGGHHSEERGLMTSDEIIRLYNAEPLDYIPVDCVAININKKYKRGYDRKDIYEAIKEAWVIAEWRRKKIKYVLAEYRGLILEVFEVDAWYEIKNKCGFTAKKDNPSISGQYVNKSIARLKNKRQWSLLYSKDLKK